MGRPLNALRRRLFYEGGATFNKWAGYNVALSRIKEPGQWVLFLDADIYLPPITARVFNEYAFDEFCMYGVDRFNCYGVDEWVKWMVKPGHVRDNWLMSMGSFELGARIVQYYGGVGEGGKFQGWIPLGFFQLVNTIAFERHPQESDGADHCDVVFAKQFPRERRIHLPDIVAIHLASHGAGFGTNWKGRKTESFIQPYEKEGGK